MLYVVSRLAASWGRIELASFDHLLAEGQIRRRIDFHPCAACSGRIDPNSD
jgi:hypothetical protein